MKNTDVYVPRTADEGLDTSLMLYLLHQINVPLRTQGWINHALLSADFVDQGCTLLRHFRGSKTSKVIFQYMEQLATAVCSTANENCYKR